MVQNSNLRLISKKIIIWGNKFGNTSKLVITAPEGSAYFIGKTHECAIYVMKMKK